MNGFRHADYRDFTGMTWFSAQDEREKRTSMMRLPLIACCALAALTAACDENGVRITSSTTNEDARGVLKVVDALQCPDTIGSLTRKGSAQADGSVCIYTGPRGAEVSLHLVRLGDQAPDAVLKGFESQLLASMPHTAAQMNGAQAQADAAAADADAARADADAARVEADAARAQADSARASNTNKNVNVQAPGMNINTEGDRAQVRMPGISIDADGDKANVRIGGFTIRADDSRSDSTASVSRPSSSTQDAVSIQAHDDSAEIRTRAPGEATRQTYLLTDNRPSPAGWRLVGYEARGPQGGPIVIATVRAKERNSDGVFDDAKDLVTLNVGD